MYGHLRQVRERVTSELYAYPRQMLRSDEALIHNLGGVSVSFANNEFEEIICRHVIEHLPYVLGFVTELRRITNPAAS